MSFVGIHNEIKAVEARVIAVEKAIAGQPVDPRLAAAIEGEGPQFKALAARVKALEERLAALEEKRPPRHKA